MMNYENDRAKPEKQIETDDSFWDVPPEKEYGDDNVPEIDNEYPDERPRHDGPGGE